MPDPAMTTASATASAQLKVVGGLFAVLGPMLAEGLFLGVGATIGAVLAVSLREFPPDAGRWAAARHGILALAMGLATAPLAVPLAGALLLKFAGFHAPPEALAAAVPMVIGGGWWHAAGWLKKKGGV